MKSTKPSVLVVDDNVPSAESMKMLLYLSGFPVVTAYSANEARRLLNRFAFDVMLLDYLMDPKINGLDFLRGCRTDGIKIPAMIVSGVESSVLDEVRLAIDSEQLGPVSVAAKPADPVAIVAEVELLGTLNKKAKV